MLQAGKLDRQVTILKPTKVRTDFGEEDEVYTTLAVVWAQVRPLSSTERYTAFADHSARSNYFRIRYRNDVTPTMRIKYENLEWEIKGITEIGRQDALDIFAEVIY